MIIKTKLEKGLEDIIGKPITESNDSSKVYGKIIDYNFETGEATLSIDEDKLKDFKWNPLIGNDIGLSSRKND